MPVIFLAAFFLFSLSAFASEVGGVEPIWEVIAPIVLGLAEKFPVIFSVILVMGFARLIMKPLMSLIRTVVELTPTKWDDKLLEKIETHKAFKIVSYILDWALSIKVGKK